MALLKEDPKKLAELLAYASTFPDFPKPFTIPSLTDPNYVPPNRSGPLLIYCYFMLGFTTLVVGLRLWIRKRVKGMIFGWDDWLIIPGQIFALGMITILILLVKIGGVGMHVYDLTYNRIENTQKLQFAGIQIYITAICLVRLSITLLLYRLMGHSQTKTWLLHITVALLLAEWLVQLLGTSFATQPISAIWNMNVRIAGFKQTINLSLEIFLLTIFCVIMDVWLLLLPISTIWTLKLPLRTRISVTWCFFFGGVACVGAILKCWYIYPVFNSYDSTWHGIGFCAAALTEVSFGIISSSMPAFNHIITTTIPRVVETWFGSTVIGSWLKSRSSGTISFKDTFTRTERGSDKMVHKTTTMEVSDYDEELPPYHAKNPGRNFSRKYGPKDTHTNKFPEEMPTYNPGWLGAQAGPNEEFDSDTSEQTASAESITPVYPASNDLKGDPHYKSWLNVR